jgi:predicted ATPase
MTSEDSRFFVITGGPGSGKSTLLGALIRAGFAASAEVGRRIIQQQVEIGGRALPWIDPALFAEMMLSWEIESYRAAGEKPGPVFFDRGVPDVLGYLRLAGPPVPDHVTRATKLFRYNRRVFICPPWPEIFAQDAERKQTLDEAKRTYDAMVATYCDCGYELVEVPRVAVQDRARFVIERAAQAS